MKFSMMPFTNMMFGTVLTVMSLMFLISWLSIFNYRKQLMFSLLAMELVLLILFIMLLLLFLKTEQPVPVTFYLMILGACEASLGLSLLVVITRAKGSDMLSLTSLLKF